MAYYKLQDLKNLKGLRNPESIPYHSKRYQEDLLRLKPYIPELQIYYVCWPQEDGYYIDDCRLIFERDGIMYRAHFSIRDGLNIYALTDRLKNISLNDKDRAGHSLEIPDKVKKITQVKVDNLIDYQKKWYRALEEISEEKTLAVNLFKKKLAACPDAKIEQESNNRYNFSGHIIRNGLKYSFEITDGCINTKLSVYYEYKYNLSIEDFEAISDNRFKMKEKK